MLHENKTDIYQKALEQKQQSFDIYVDHLYTAVDHALTHAILQEDRT